MYYRLWLGSGIRPPRTIPLGPKLIKLLPPMQQMVLQLRHINGMEMAQVAQLTGMKEPAVRKCLSRARQALRTMMLKMMKEA